MKIEEKTIFETKSFQLNAQIFYAKNNNHKLGTLIYYHGGGLIFGSSNDLSMQYIDILTEKFDIVAVNYRLIPESSLYDILEDVEHAYQFAQSLNNKVYVFGRSAGGFLAYLTAKHYKIEGAIIMYGYYDFSHPNFKQLPKDQQKYNKMLSSSIEKRNTRDYITTKENPNPRFLLYLYYRDKNIWTEKMQVDLSDGKYYLTEEDLKNMPKTFLVHAKEDPDVPFDYSKRASELIKESKLIELELNEHDFDRDVSEQNINYYKEAVKFFN